MVGVGSMGSMMSLLYAEKGCHVYYFDISMYHGYNITELINRV